MDSAIHAGSKQPRDAQMIATSSPFPQYFDLSGRPLTDGKLYFGTPSLDPRTSPIPVFWDAAGTIPAAQPIRTLNGYTARNGTPAPIFVGGVYALLVHDKRDVQMAYSPSSLEWDAIAQANAQSGVAEGHAAAAAASAASAANQATAAANAALASRAPLTDFANGFYIPVFDNFQNISGISVISSFYWVRTKRFVQVGCGSMQINASNSTIHSFSMSLPIKSGLITIDQSGMSGLISSENAAYIWPGVNLGSDQTPAFLDKAAFTISRVSSYNPSAIYTLSLTYFLPPEPTPRGHAIQGGDFQKIGSALTLNPDGTSNENGLANWHTNPVANIGASYWVRATRTGGNAGSAAPASFTSLASGVIVSVSPGAPMSGTLEFSRSASGSPVEAVSTFSFT
jgi:hypothetical protein